MSAGSEDTARRAGSLPIPCFFAGRHNLLPNRPYPVSDVLESQTLEGAGSFKAALWSRLSPMPLSPFIFSGRFSLSRRPASSVAEPEFSALPAALRSSPDRGEDVAFVGCLLWKAILGSDGVGEVLGATHKPKRE